MLINPLKSRVPHWGGKWKIDSEYVSGTEAPPKVKSVVLIRRPNHNTKFQ